MKSNNIYALCTVLALFTLMAGCSTQLAQVGDPACRYTQASYTHVYPRHCDPLQFTGKSKFGGGGAAYCNGVQGGQNLCQTVQNAPSKRTIQADGRICYDKDMGTVIGTAGERWARVIIDPVNGEVVTQFPEAGSGCR